MNHFLFDGTGWYHCVMGEPLYPINRCPEGTLFDETALQCLQSEVVSCAVTSHPTPAQSTPQESQTVAPSRYSEFPSASEIDEKGRLTNIPTVGFSDSPPDKSANPTLLESSRPTQIQQRQTLRPSEQPSTVHSLFPSDAHTKPPSQLFVKEPTNKLPLDAFCPDEYTGVMPWNDCMGYYYCTDSIPHLPIISCKAGRLFDVTSSACLDASQVDCSEIVESNTGQYPSHPTILPTKSPIGHTAQPFLTSESTIPTFNLSPEHDEKPASTTILAGADNSGDSSHQTPSDSQIVSSLSEENIQYDWSSTSDMSSNEYVPNSGLPQDFSFDGPFVTVELLLNEYPGDIGWQLLGLDGTIHIEKPVGANSSLEPNTTLFEFIPVQPSTSRSAALHELEWTITNVKGMGLNGGYWKMYSAAPNERTLLATGVDFGYSDTLWLIVSNDGHITLRDDNALSHQPPDPPLPMLPTVDATPNQDAIYVENSGLHTQIAESSHPNEIQSPKSITKNRTLLTPLLASVVAVAFVAGVIFLFLASRKNARNFDEWNIEEPSERDFFDEYPKCEQSRWNHMYFDDHSNSIDPPGLFDRYETDTDDGISLDELPESISRRNSDLDAGPVPSRPANIVLKVSNSLSHQKFEEFDEDVNVVATP